MVVELISVGTETPDGKYFKQLILSILAEKCALLGSGSMYYQVTVGG